MEASEIIMYESEDGATRLEVQLDGDTVWLAQAQIAELFGVNSQAITKHLKNIYGEGELDESLTCSKMEQVRVEGKREVKRAVKVYNLDAVISVGYRVNSKRTTHFRRWATSVLRDYIVKGFALDDDRLKRGGSFGKACSRPQAARCSKAPASAPTARRWRRPKPNTASTRPAPSLSC